MILHSASAICITRKLNLLVIIGLIFLYPVGFYLYSVKYPSVHRMDYTSSNNKDYFIDTKGCRIPKFHPFDPSVSIFFYEKSSPLARCHELTFLLVDEDKIVLNTDVTDISFEHQTLKCVYQPIIRDPNNSPDKADHEVKLGEVRPLIFGKPLKDEFVRVECFIRNKSAFVDYLALVILKPDVEKRCDAASASLDADPLNVIVIAIDSISKLNFMRHFPMTKGLLETKLKHFEFHGHNKVADNTFVNMVPLLTGHFVAHYRKKEDVRSTYYDNLDFVWKEFAALGYRTFFIEDTPNAGTFSYAKRGFKKPATDYYLRPFAVAVESTKWRTKNGYHCYGHTSETEFFYGYFREFVSRMGKRPYFAFTFISRPTHDNLNTAGYVDEPTFLLLQDLIETNVLNNSALIFFSDHGIRFGNIRETYIGKIEERMPFMYQYYPEWFLKKHEDIRRALTINQKRLTTPFDVHKTLQDIVTLSSKNGVKTAKEDCGYGQSLFREISPERTCEVSHIIPHWCVCHSHIKFNKYENKSIRIAEKMIAIINQLTSSNRLCVVQQLEDIVDAYVSMPESRTLSSSESMNHLYYLITAKASPSKAIFEGTFKFNSNAEILPVGEISRINSYGNQSWCTDDQVLKKYCFCQN